MITRPILDADYAAIEARIVNWLAGQDDIVQRFYAYDRAKTKEEKHQLDPYRIMASQIYGIPVAQVNKMPQRFVGKGAELGAGYGLGPPKFRTNCKKVGNYDLPQGLEFKAINTWRSTHKKVVAYWYMLENAAKSAIVRKGEVFHARKVSFKCKDIEGIPFLLMKLPSGRNISYPKPRISEDRITFFGNIPTTQRWGDISMWGGVLANNATQGVAADIMINGAQNAENAGYEIMSLIHDQALAYYREGQTVEEFVRLLTKLPSWADGLPVEAEGSLVPFYKKD